MWIGKQKRLIEGSLIKSAAGLSASPHKRVWVDCSPSGRVVVDDGRDLHPEEQVQGDLVVDAEDDLALVPPLVRPLHVL